MGDLGDRLALWGVLVIAGVFVMVLLALGAIAGRVLGSDAEFQSEVTPAEGWAFARPAPRVVDP